MSQQPARISHERMDEPHIRGRRVSVLQIHEQVEGCGADPADVASQLALDILDVNAALRYYAEHPDEMSAVRQQRRDKTQQLHREIAAERPSGLSPE